MHPINKKNFGAAGIACTFHNGTAVTTGYIVKQLGSNRFSVTDGTVVQSAVLAATSALATTPTPGTFTIPLVTPVSGGGAVLAATYAVSSATPGAGGTSYTVGNTLIFSANSLTLAVTAVSTGAITSVSVANAGAYTTLPSGTVTPSSSTAGSGATFHLTFNLGSISASTAGTAYAAGQPVSFIGLTASTVPVAKVGTVNATGGISAVTVVSAGANITVAATSLGVGNVTENVAAIYAATCETVQGHRWPWHLGAAAGTIAGITAY